MATPSSTCIACAVSGESSPRAVFDVAASFSEPHGTTADKVYEVVKGLCPQHLETAIVLHVCVTEAFDRRSRSSLRAVRDDEPAPAPTTENPFTHKEPPKLSDHYKDLTPPTRANPFEPKQPPLQAALQEQLKSLLNAPITVAALAELQKTAALARKLLELQDPKAKLMQKFGAGGGYGGGAVLSPGYLGGDFDPEVDNVGDFISPVGALAPAPGSETFGAAVIRELIPAIKGQNKPRLHLADLMEALHMAQENNNTAMVEKLQVKINHMLEDALDEEERDDKSALDDVCSHEGCDQLPMATKSNKRLCLEHYDKASIEAGVST